MAEKRNMDTECLATPPQNAASPQPQPQSFQQQPLMQPQQPLVIQMRRPAPKRYDKFKTVLARKLGIAQIVCGVLAVILNAVGLGVQTHAHDYLNNYRNRNNNDGWGNYYWNDSSGYAASTGFWCPLFFFLSGSFAIWASKRPTRCVIIACLVMTIISCVMAAIMFAVAAYIVADDAKRLAFGFEYEKHYNAKYNGSHYGSTRPPEILYNRDAEKWAKAVMPISPLFFIVSIIQLVVMIWSTQLCGSVLCSDDQEPDEQYQGVQYQANYGQPQLMVLDRHGRPITGAQVVQIPGAMPGTTMQPTGQVNAYGMMAQPTGQVNAYGMMTQPAGQVNAYGVMAQPMGQINPSGVMVQPTGQVTQPVQPPTSGQTGEPAILQPGENQPRSQTGEDSPPPPYQ